MCDYKFDMELCKRQIERTVTPIEKSVSLHIRSNPNGQNPKKLHKEYMSSPESQSEFEAMFDKAKQEYK